MRKMLVKGFAKSREIDRSLSCPFSANLAESAQETVVFLMEENHGQLRGASVVIGGLGCSLWKRGSVLLSTRLGPGDSGRGPDDDRRNPARPGQRQRRASPRAIWAGRGRGSFLGPPPARQL